MAGSELVQALLRGLDIVSAVGQAEDGLRPSEVAEQLGLKGPTAHNLVRTLLAREFLSRGGDGRLRLGPALARCHQQQQDRRVLRGAEAAMQDLGQRHPRMTLTFAEVVGSEIAFELRLGADRPGVLQRLTGQTFHPYANASGLACLAFAPDDLVQPVRERFPFYEFGAHLWGTPDRFAAQLASFRERGYAELPFEGQETYRFAVPIRRPDGLFVGVLGSSNRLVDAADEATRTRLRADVLERSQAVLA